MNMIFPLLIFLASIDGLEVANPCESLNNNFALSPFKKGKIAISAVDELLGKQVDVQKDIVKSQFYSTSDTLIRFRTGDSEIIFYKGPRSTFMYKASIEDSNILFAFDFRVGDTREKIVRLLNLDSNLNCDEIKIFDEEHFSNHVLIFEKDRLTKVVLDFGLN